MCPKDGWICIPYWPSSSLPSATHFYKFLLHSKLFQNSNRGVDLFGCGLIMYGYIQHRAECTDWWRKCNCFRAILPASPVSINTFMLMLWCQKNILKHWSRPGWSIHGRHVWNGVVTLNFAVRPVVVKESSRNHFFKNPSSSSNIWIQTVLFLWLPHS